MAEALSVPLRRHTADRVTVLVDRLAKMLEFLAEGVARENIDDTKEVDMLLVCAQQPAVIGLVESLLVFFDVATVLEVEGIQRVQRRGIITRWSAHSVLLLVT